MVAKILKDPVVIFLAACSGLLIAIYVLGGGDGSSSLLVRDCINCFWFGTLPMLVAYLLVSPFLQLWLRKSTTGRSRTLKRVTAFIIALIIAAITVYILFLIALATALGSTTNG